VAEICEERLGISILCLHLLLASLQLTHLSPGVLSASARWHIIRRVDNRQDHRQNGTQLRHLLYRLSKPLLRLRIVDKRMPSLMRQISAREHGAGVRVELVSRNHEGPPRIQREHPVAEDTAPPQTLQHALSLARLRVMCPGRIGREQGLYVSTCVLGVLYCRAHPEGILLS
jgi:hypothetical protein